MENFKSKLLDIKEDEYRRYPFISQSVIKQFLDHGPGGLIPNKDMVTPIHFIKGSLLDTLIFEPELFDERFTISDIERPVDTIVAGCKDMLRNNIENPTDDELLAFFTSWDNRIKDRTKRIDSLKVIVLPYYELLVKAGYKQIITTNELAKARILHQAVLNHPADLFPNINPSYIDIYRQPKLVVSLFGIAVKMMFDMLIINHQNKTIRVRDLKTGHYPNRLFHLSFMENKYFIQGAVYQLGVKEFIKGTDLESYTVLPFEFIYASNTTEECSLHEMSPDYEDMILNGYTNGYSIVKPLSEIINDMAWHLDRFSFIHSRQLIENDMKSTLSIPVSWKPYAENKSY